MTPHKSSYETLKFTDRPSGFEARSLHAPLYSQVLQEYPDMDHLQREFNHLLGVTGEEKVQMAVRLGRRPTPYYCYRRNLESFNIGRWPNGRCRVLIAAQMMIEARQRLKLTLAVAPCFLRDTLLARVGLLIGG